MADVADDALVQHLNRLGLATREQIDEARLLKASMAQSAHPISLCDALIQRGVITALQKSNIEKRLATQNSGIKMLGKFKLLSKLGEGGMGAVYLAEDNLAGRQVAIKVLARKFALDHEFISRFRREARAAGKLNHPNIVAAYSVHEDEGNHFYAMEYCSGEPLSARLKRAGFLPWKTALEIAAQVTRGLQYAHERGIIHRDIKPDNIFLAFERPEEPVTAKILDLGLSKDISSEQSFTTQAGMTVGTPHYISPEQAQALQTVDGRTDIYSLGATLYHVLTGKTPFEAGNASMIIIQHITGQIPNPQDIREEIPDQVVQVVQKMMAKDPEDRYSSCEELLEDLELVLAGRSPSSAALDFRKSSIALRSAVRPTRLAPRASTDSRDPLKKRRTEGPRGPERKADRLLLYAGLSGGGGLLLLVLLLMLLKGKPGTSIPKDTVLAETPKRPPALVEAAPNLVEPPKALALSSDPLKTSGTAVNISLNHPEDWDQFVQSLPAEEQVKQVVEKLKKLNPKYDGKETHVIERGEVVEFTLRATFITDISPVRVLTHLQKLNCSEHDHAWVDAAPFSDLSPLKDLKLTALRCAFTHVKDLSSLKNMPLQSLNLWGTEADLSTLKDQKQLREINCQFNPARDTSALKMLTTLEKINDKSVAEFWAKNSTTKP